mgnify:CR=1 FL=1
MGSEMCIRDRKNILIRGVKTGIRGNRAKEIEAYRACAGAVKGDLTLFRLFFPDGEKEGN